MVVADGSSSVKAADTESMVNEEDGEGDGDDDDDDDDVDNDDTDRPPLLR